MKRLVFSPLARSDLIDIALYIAEDNPGRAESLIAELEEKARTIAERPASFPLRDELSPGLRSAVHGRYVLFFRDLGSEVRIVRVLHGARDLRRAFNA